MLCFRIVDKDNIVEYHKSYEPNGILKVTFNLHLKNGWMDFDVILINIIT